MKALISGAKYTLCVTLAIFTCHANAEHYVVCCEQPASVVYITCKHHHCSWSSQPPRHPCYSHIRRHHYVKHRPVKHFHYRHHQYRYIEKVDRCCDQDMATGDDNPCLYPEMQIN